MRPGQRNVFYLQLYYTPRAAQIIVGRQKCMSRYTALTTIRTRGGVQKHQVVYVRLVRADAKYIPTP